MLEMEPAIMQYFLQRLGYSGMHSGCCIGLEFLLVITKCATITEKEGLSAFKRANPSLHFAVCVLINLQKFFVLHSIPITSNTIINTTIKNNPRRSFAPLLFSLLSRLLRPLWLPHLPKRSAMHPSGCPWTTLPLPPEQRCAVAAFSSKAEARWLPVTLRPQEVSQLLQLQG